MKVNLYPYYISSKLAGQQVTLSIQAKEQSLQVVYPQEYGVITFFRTIFPAKLGGLIAPLPHHSAKKPSLVPLCVKMAAHIASSAVKRQGRLRSSALSQSALAP